MKSYYIQHRIGKAKHVINFHNGEKKHKDGSAFYDIRIFKNKKDLEAFEKSLLKQNYEKEGLKMGTKDFPVSIRMDADAFRLLREQKAKLLQAINHSNLDDDMLGIVHTIDSIQDQAVGAGHFTEEQVFGKKKKLFIATVQIAVDGDACGDINGACEWISGLLTDNNEVFDWAYGCDHGEGYPTPQESEVEAVGYNEGDLFKRKESNATP